MQQKKRWSQVETLCEIIRNACLKQSFKGKLKMYLLSEMVAN